MNEWYGERWWGLKGGGCSPGISHGRKVYRWLRLIVGCRATDDDDDDDDDD